MTDTMPPVRAPSDNLRDWSELPLDALTSVFAKLGAIEVLMGAGLVCRSWLEAAKAPDLWRFVDMVRHKVVKDLGKVSYITAPSSPVSKRKKPDIGPDVLCAMAKVAVDRARGQLQVFMGKRFVTDELLKYIADRSPSLKRLGLISCNSVSDKVFAEAVTKFPQLEGLLLVLCQNIGGRDVYETTGKACTQLKRFWLRKYWSCTTEEGEALGVAAMHELRSLRLVHSNLTNDELSVILDGCPHLGLLDLRGCYNIDVDDALRNKCSRIKTLTLPVFRAAHDEDDYETLSSRDCDYDWQSD